jgi:hypothetical protein
MRYSAQEQSNPWKLFRHKVVSVKNWDASSTVQYLFIGNIGYRWQLFPKFQFTGVDQCEATRGIVKKPVWNFVCFKWAQKRRKNNYCNFLIFFMMLINKNNMEIFKCSLSDHMSYYFVELIEQLSQLLSCTYVQICSGGQSYSYKVTPLRN